MGDEGSGHRRGRLHRLPYGDRLLDRGDEVVGLDNLNDYYDVDAEAGAAGAARRRARASASSKLDLADRDGHGARCSRASASTRVVHLAAQAGVRYSLENPARLRRQQPRRLPATCSRAAGTTASSTWSTRRPARSTAPTRRCRSRCTTTSTIRCQLYAATKKANELMAHTYATSSACPTTGLRFFTVYGPWGRPGHGAVPVHARPSSTGKPIDVFNHGQHAAATSPTSTTSSRAWCARSTASPQPDPDWDGDAPDPATSSAPYRALQHRQQPAGRAAALHRGARAVARAEGGEEPAAAAAGRRAGHLRRRRRPGAATSASGRRRRSKTGVRRFVEWYREYYGKA